MPLKERPTDQYEALHTFIQQVENEIDRVLEEACPTSWYQPSASPKDPIMHGKPLVKIDCKPGKDGVPLQEVTPVRNHQETGRGRKFQNMQADCDIGASVNSDYAEDADERMKCGNTRSRWRGNGVNVHADEKHQMLVDKKKEFERRKAAICFGIGPLVVPRSDTANSRKSKENGCRHSTGRISSAEKNDRCTQKAHSAERYVVDPAYNRSRRKSDSESYDVHSNLYSVVDISDNKSKIPCRKVKDLQRLLDTDRDALLLGLEYHSTNEDIDNNFSGLLDCHSDQLVESDVVEDSITDRLEQMLKALEQMPQNTHRRLSYNQHKKVRQKPEPSTRQKQQQQQQPSQHFCRYSKHVPVCHHPQHYQHHHDDNSRNHEQRYIYHQHNHSENDDQYCHHCHRHSHHQGSSDHRCISEPLCPIGNPEFIKSSPDQQALDRRSFRNSDPFEELDESGFRNSDPFEALASSNFRNSDPFDEEKKRQRSELLCRIYEDVKKITRPLQQENVQTCYGHKQQLQHRKRPQQYYHCQHQQMDDGHFEQNASQGFTENQVNVNALGRSRQLQDHVSSSERRHALQENGTTNDHISASNNRIWDCNTSIHYSSDDYPAEYRPRGFSDSETDFLQNFWEQDWLSGSDVQSPSMDTPFYSDSYEPNLGLCLYQRVVKPKGKKFKRRSFSMDGLGNISLAEYVTLHSKKYVGVYTSDQDHVKSETPHMVCEKDTRSEVVSENRHTLDRNSKAKNNHMCVAVPEIMDTSISETTLGNPTGLQLGSSLPLDSLYPQDLCQQNIISLSHGEGAHSKNNDVMDISSPFADVINSEPQTWQKQQGSQTPGKASNKDALTKEKSSNRHDPTSVALNEQRFCQEHLAKVILPTRQPLTFDDTLAQDERHSGHKLKSDGKVTSCKDHSNDTAQRFDDDCSKSPSLSNQTEGTGGFPLCIEVPPLNSGMDEEPDYLEEILCGQNAANTSFSCSFSSDLSDRDSLFISSGEEEDNQHNISAVDNKSPNADNNIGGESAVHEDKNKTSRSESQGESSSTQFIDTIVNDNGTNGLKNELCPEDTCNEDNWFNAYPTVSRAKPSNSNGCFAMSSNGSGNPDMMAQNNGGLELETESNGVEEQNWKPSTQSSDNDDVLEKRLNNDRFEYQKDFADAVSSQLMSRNDTFENDIDSHSIGKGIEEDISLTDTESHVRERIGKRRFQDTAIQTSLDLGDTVDVSDLTALEVLTDRRSSGTGKPNAPFTGLVEEQLQASSSSKYENSSRSKFPMIFSKGNKQMVSVDGDGHNKEQRFVEASDEEASLNDMDVRSKYGSRLNKPYKPYVTRSKSIHGDKDVEEKRSMSLNLPNPSLSGSLKELSHLNIDVSQKLVDGEKRYVVTNGSPEMQMMVNALTPVLSRRNRSGRRSDKKRTEVTSLSENYEDNTEPQNVLRYVSEKKEEACLSKDEKKAALTDGTRITSEETLPIFARLKSYDGCVTAYSGKLETDSCESRNMRKKELYRISDELKQISQMPEDAPTHSIRRKRSEEESISSTERKMIGRSEDRYLVKDINTAKDELFISPKFANTWHGYGHRRSEIVHRPAPRMGVGMVFADNTKYLAAGNDTRRHRNVRDTTSPSVTVSTSLSSPSGSSSFTSGTLSLQTYTLPVISRTLLDAMHKRYCSHQYARQNATILQPFSLLRIDPTSSHGGEPMTALRVEPKPPHQHEVVQVTTGSDEVKTGVTMTGLTSDGESDISSSATDSLQSSPRQAHLTETSKATALTTSISPAIMASSSPHHPLHHSPRLPLESPHMIPENDKAISDLGTRPQFQQEAQPTVHPGPSSREIESSDVSDQMKEPVMLTSQEDEVLEIFLHPPDCHLSDSVATTPSSSPRPDRLHPGSKNRAELEAVEAIQWLRAAGFPQYAQMFEDGLFPIELALVEKDHDFLDKDSIQSLFRRLETLNKYAGMKLDAHQRKKAASEEEEDDDICALSERWQYQKSVRRWSRKDLGLSSKATESGDSGDLTRGGSHDSLLADQDSGSQTGDSPLLESKMPHQDTQVLDGANQKSAAVIAPGEPLMQTGNNPISPKLRRVASERIKTAKSLWKKMEGGLRSKKSRRHPNQRNILEISGPVVADQENMQAKLERLNCVDISPTSPGPGGGRGSESGAPNAPIFPSPAPQSPTSPHIPNTPPSALQPHSPDQTGHETQQRVVAPSSPTPPSPLLATAAFRSRHSHGSQSLRVKPTYVKDDSSDTNNHANASATSSSMDSTTLREYYNAQSQLLQTLESSGPARKISGNDPGLVEIFVLPQDHQPGMFPRVLQNGYIEADLSGTALNPRTGSIRLGRDLSKSPDQPSANSTSSGSAGHSKRLGNRVSMYDNFAPATDMEKGTNGANKPASVLAGVDEDASSTTTTTTLASTGGVYQSQESKDRSVSFDSARSGQEQEDFTRRHSYRELRDRILSEASTPSLTLRSKQESFDSAQNEPIKDAQLTSPSSRGFKQSVSVDSYLKDTGSDVIVSHSRKSSSGSSSGSHGNRHANTSLSEQFSEFDVILQQLFDNISDLTRCMGRDETESSVQYTPKSSSQEVRLSDATVSSITTTSSLSSSSSATAPSSSSISLTVTTTSVSFTSSTTILSTSSSKDTTQTHPGSQVLSGLVIPASSTTSEKSAVLDQSQNPDPDILASPNSDSVFSPSSPLSPTSVDKSLDQDHENSSSGGGDSHTGESISDQEGGLGDFSHDDSLEQIPAVARERRDSGVGHSLTRAPSDRRRKKIRWHSFQKCHRPDVGTRNMQINSLTVSQMVWLRKLSLLKLTGIMERCLPVNKSGWNWVVPKFMKKHKTPDFSDKNVFGVPLSVMVQRTGQPLPQCVLYAMRYLRRTSQNAVGIFRRSGVKSKIQHLIDRLEANPDFTDFEDMNAYNVADMLKTFFRELPECLLTNKLSETFRNIYTHVPPGQRLEAIQAAILILPDENREVLQSLLLFLSDISIHEADHQMNAVNLAVCFTPTVFMLGARQNTLSHSPKRHRKNAQGLPGVPDPREIMEQKTSQDCLLLMITECKKLFTVPPNLFRQVQTQSLINMEPPQMFDLCGEDANVNDEVRAFGQERVQMVLKEAHDKNRGWIPAMNISHIDVSHRKSMDDYPLREWKLVVDIDAPPIEVLRRIMHERHTWDEDLLSWSVVERINPHADIFQFVLNSMAPHPCRHFCVLRYWRSDLQKGACALVTMSVEHTDAMEVQGVRAIDLGSFFLMEPCGSGRSRLTHVIRVDTRGRRPEWYTKVFGHVSASFLERLRDSFKQDTSGPETKV